MTTGNSITANDLRRLQNSPSEEVRHDIARKVCEDVKEEKLSPSEKLLALSIVKSLAIDQSVAVRKELADSFAKSANAPKDVMLTLAQDESDQIAVSVLRNYPGFTEEDLLMLVEVTQQVARLIAVARRDEVPTKVCHELISKKIAEVSEALVENMNARIAPEDFVAIAQELYSSEIIMKGMMKRRPIPDQAISVAIGMATEKAKSRVNDNESRYAVENTKQIKPLEDPSVLNRIIALGGSPKESECDELSAEFNTEGLLKAETLGLALCLGYPMLFEAFLHLQTRIPKSELKQMLAQGMEGANQAFTKTRVPAGTADLYVKLYRELVNLQKEGFSSGAANTVGAMLEKLGQVPHSNIPYAKNIKIAVENFLNPEQW
jgi:uncharacterized protein (DUF2336 family)